MKRILVLISCMAFLGCGDDEVEVTADETSVPADSGTVVRSSLSGGGEQKVEFSTTGGFVGIVASERTVQMTSSLGRADLPFDCVGEVGIHTVTVTYVDDGISGSVDIECTPVE